MSNFNGPLLSTYVVILEYDEAILYETRKDNDHGL